MVLYGIIIILIILVIWLATTSYVPLAIYSYLRLPSAMTPPGMTKWEFSTSEAAAYYATMLQLKFSPQQNTSRLAFSPPPMAPTTVVQPVATVVAPSVETKPVAPAVATPAVVTPAPAVEKFRSNLAHLFGAERA